jgi:hypothetical protein
MSRIRANQYTDRSGTGAPTCPAGLVVSTASTVGYALTVTGDLNVTGSIPKAAAFSIALGM